MDSVSLKKTNYKKECIKIMEINLWCEVKEDGKIIGDFHDSNGMDELLEFIRDDCKGKNIRHC